MRKLDAFVLHDTFKHTVVIRAGGGNGLMFRRAR
jgi:hypothetical protein